MRRYASLLVVAVGITAACGSANVEQERSNLLELDRQWSQTTTDIEKFLSFYSPDASVYPQGMPIATGESAIRETFTQLTSMPGFALQFSPTKADVGAGGNIGYTTGTYEVTINDAAGNPTSEKGKYVCVWKKQADGQWKVVEDIFNADTDQRPAPGQHVLLSSSGITWGEGPPSLPPGAKFAVVSGDPGKAVPYAIRAQVPAGYRIAPHWHPSDESVTVLSGTVAFGMGETFDAAALKDVGAGGFAVMPAEMRHFFQAKTAATIQVHGMGPFAITYVNPADDPRQKQ